ncbi:MAG: DUF370 domain-containing protein [Ruminococcus bromii]|uniref:DUF370 domain-containing protein n=1 Tax=Ruminococcus sp. YE282 TaxID=3158780 RepID=UPI0008904C75|nr:DUF370 domain-containing protein [Ruminococcus bromii]HCB95937.1 DUF370 domain-containing protein [Ruminococcus sp.]MCI7212432.1 DUF370 domain-containing protein [Ruminococcus bromii]MDD6433409.1 DUF370 domain-containing protein [Ruminococcus bromii]MDY4084725.1 DUF370 domain-containing protein [Ruminococcus bromii]
MKLINIGFGNLVSSDKLVSIVAPDSAPVKRIVQEAKSNGMLIDATCGRKCKSVLITDSNHVILSAVSSEAIQNRTEEGNGEHNEQ